MTSRVNERGGALVMAMMLVVVTGTLLTAMTQGNRFLMTDTVDERATMQALQAAEGGIEQARWRLQHDPKFAGEVLRIGNAEVTVKVLALPGGGPSWQATATARTQPRGANGLRVQQTVVATLVGDVGLPAATQWRQLGSGR